MSVLILCAKGRREGEWALGEAGRGLFFALWNKAGTALQVLNTGLSIGIYVYIMLAHMSWIGDIRD